MRRLLIPLLVCAGGCALLVCAPRHHDDHATPEPPTKRPPRPPAELISGSASEHPAAAPSPRVDELPPMSADPLGGDLIAPFMRPEVLADMEETTLPTEHGLYLRSVAWWDQEDFEALTCDELAKLLPDEKDYVLTGDKPLLALVNGLPTDEDCARGFADPAVQRALVEVCRLEIPLIALDYDRLPELEEQRRTMRAQFNAAEAALMHELERATGYAHWSFLHRAFSAWMAQ